MINFNELSIIIPTRNEEGNITACVRRVATACPGAEILVVDGGTDATSARCSELSREVSSLRYIPNPNDRGKGHAVRVGIEHAKGKYLAQIDADLQFRPEELVLLLSPLYAGDEDMALGSRFCRGAIRRPGSTPLARRLGNMAFSAVASIIFAHRFTDILAGMKAWNRKVTDAGSITSDSYSYEIELPGKATMRGFKVIDIPITTEPRTAGVSSVRVLRVAATLLVDMVSFRWGE